MSKLGSQLMASILVNAIYEMKNYPVILVNTVISPLSFLILIVFVSRGELLGVAILGGLIMTMFQAGGFLQSDLSHLKNDFKLQEMVVASPTKAGVYVTGIAISELIYSSPALIILSALFGVYVHTSLINVLGIIAVLMMMFVTSVALGFAFGTMSTDIVQSFAFSRLITTLFSTLAPVYYPISYLPEPVRTLAYLSPTTYAAQLSHGLAGFQELTIETAAIDWGVLLGITVFCLWIGLRKARWRDR